MKGDLLRGLAWLLPASAHQLPLPDKSMYMVVTSPPYFGPRRYDADPIVLGGDPSCAHDFDVRTYDVFVAEEDFEAPNKVRGTTIGAHRGQTHMRSLKGIQSGVCVKCGAYYGHYGLEQTHDCGGWVAGQMCGQCYVCHTRMIFREIYRVLRDDGTLWLNLGDRYNSNARRDGSYEMRHGQTLGNRRTMAQELPRKNLLMTPQRAALALQADGWIVRNDIVWIKPNAVPGPEEDRVVASHEHVYVMAKKGRYWFDYHPLQEEAVSGGYRRGRDVWTVNTSGYGGEHFATFPEELPRRAIQAGAALWACESCGAPAYVYTEDDRKKGRKNVGGFRPTCRCGVRGATMVQGKSIVMDPFGGAGTTALAAVRLRRKVVSVDVSPTYIEQQRVRLYKELFGTEPPGRKPGEIDWTGTLFEL